MRTSFLTAVLLVTSEVVKELPATLILRPFNFDTLAVITYTYAAEERMYQAALPSLAIVIIGIIPIIFLTKMIRSSRIKRLMTQNILKIEDLSLSYANQEVLKDVNLKLSKGERVSILGESGSGKVLF